MNGAGKVMLTSKESGMYKVYKIAGLSPILAVGVFLVASQFAVAVRYVNYEVSMDGKVVMKTSTWDNGHPDADSVWRVWMVYCSKKSKALRRSQMQMTRYATLKGNVVIQTAYGGRAEVTQLQLVKESEFAPWKIDPAEVERTLKSRHKLFAFGVSIDGSPKLWTVPTMKRGR